MNGQVSSQPVTTIVTASDLPHFSLSEVQQCFEIEEFGTTTTFDNIPLLPPDQILQPSQNLNSFSSQLVSGKNKKI